MDPKNPKPHLQQSLAAAGKNGPYVSDVNSNPDWQMVSLHTNIVNIIQFPGLNSCDTDGNLKSPIDCNKSILSR